MRASRSGRTLRTSFEALEPRAMFAAGTLHVVDDADISVPGDGVGVVSGDVNATDAPTAAIGPASPGAGGDVTPGWAHYWFRVTYADDVAVTKSTVGTGDVRVTGPGGYSQAGALSNIVAADSGWTATYRVPAPGGSWNPADNGTYTIHMAADEVFDDAGQAVPAGPLGNIVVDILDIAEPTATLTAADVTTGGAYHWFRVRYADDVGLNGATIGSGDVLVTGPNGYSELGTLANRVVSAPTATVTYRIPAPGGAWGRSDNGAYTVAVRSGEVTDTAGNAVPDFPIGTFFARFADATPPTATLGASDATTAGRAYHWFQVVYSDNVGIASGVIDGQDILVTGPDGYAQPAVLSNLVTSGSTRTATYRVSAPGGSFGAEDNGTYTVSLNPDQVSDTSGNFAAAGTLGTFQVNVPPPASPAGPAVGAGVTLFSESPIVPGCGPLWSRPKYDAADLLH